MILKIFVVCVKTCLLQMMKFWRTPQTIIKSQIVCVRLFSKENFQPWPWTVKDKFRSQSLIRDQRLGPAPGNIIQFRENVNQIRKLSFTSTFHIQQLPQSPISLLNVYLKIRFDFTMIHTRAKNLFIEIYFCFPLQRICWEISGNTENFVMLKQKLGNS